MQINQRKKDALDETAAKDAAAADLLNTKRAIQDVDSTRACKMAVTNFTLDAMGAGCPQAGGAKATKEPLRDG